MAVIKDEENELPIPHIWRSVFCQIVKSFSKNDYLINSTLPNVLPLSFDDAKLIQEYIESYGEKLAELPPTAWDSSIYLWMRSYWQVLIDLWTIGEGQSDLVLSAKVYEADKEYCFKVEMVYVP